MNKSVDQTNFDESFNGNYTAQPKAQERIEDADALANGADYGEMNVEDAKESGYTDEAGEAVDMAKPDIEGSPTGALTDVGAGRSGVVRPRH